MKFSVIICTYNSIGRLAKTLDSILTQSLNDFEVLIIDGDSTDGTIDAIKNYEKKFSGRLKFASEKDSGIYDAMNKGIGIARGEFLVFIGAGDWFEKDAFEQSAKCIELHTEVDAVYGKTRIFDADLKDNRVMQTGPEELPSYPMQHPSLFYKKTLHDKYGFYDENYHIAADYSFCLKAFHVGKAKAVPFDAIVANFVMDGASSEKQFLCLVENVRARKEAGINVNIFSESVTYFKNKAKFAIFSPKKFLKKYIRFIIS